MNLSQLNRILQQMFWLPVFALLLVSTILVWQISSAVHTVDQIQLADHNIERAMLISSLIVDEETALRGYQNTGNQIFLQPYDMAARPLTAAMSDLRQGIIHSGGDPTVLDRLADDHERWHTEIAIPLIVAVRTGSDTHDTGINLRAKTRMDTVRAQLDRITEGQRGIRNQAVTRWQSQVHHTIEVVVGLSILIGMMLGVWGRSQLHEVSLAFQNALSALRRHGQQVHASEQRLRTMLASIADAVIVCDIAGRTELMNAVAEQLTGWTVAEALHQSIDKIVQIVDESTREALPPVTTVIRTQTRMLPKQCVLLQRGGGEITIDASSAPILDTAGRITGLVLIFRDITDQRHTQAALLASEKLAVAGRLAATIAHEIHNPLDAVMNLLYLMRQGATPEEMREFLAMASTEIDRVSQISRAMLGMYRESRTPVALDLSELLRSLLLLLDSHFMQVQVRAEADLHEHCIVTGFPAELRQVFTNLLTNALDASERGGTVTISAHCTIAPEAAGVVVTVSDTGSGIPPEAMDHLFQPFFTTKGEQGTGLGLWVSQGILEKHGGNIRVESKTGEEHGTTITVFLPRGELQLAQPPASLFASSEAVS